MTKLDELTRKETWLDSPTGIDSFLLNDQTNNTIVIPDTVKPKLQPHFKDAIFHYVDVASIPPSEISSYMEQYKNQIKDIFDTSGVLFLPVRGAENALKMAEANSLGLGRDY